MEKKKRVKHPRLEDIIPDPERRAEVVSRLYKGDPVVGEGGIFTDLLQALVNAALEGEMDYNLPEIKKEHKDNRRNGHTNKVLRSRVGPLEVKTPRDRDGLHQPILVKKWDRELGTGMDDIILSLYARGHSIDDVRFQLRQLYGVEVSAGAISAVTDRVWSEILEWQQRPLAPCYPIVYLDAIHYHVREDGKVVSKAVYTAYGVSVDGYRDILGLYLSESEGARQWGLILEDLKRRGVQDILFCCIDGLTGLTQIIGEVFPLTIVQRCIVHMIRTSTRFVADKDIRRVCADLRKIYTAPNRQQASLALEEFSATWNKKYKEIQPKWETHWDELMNFMDYRDNIRRMIYTTNPVEALHRIMRKVTKSKGAWINEKGLLKQLYLSLMSKKESWNKIAFKWVPIQRELIDQFGERYEKYLN
jgi:transposase-like protein